MFDMRVREFGLYVDAEMRKCKDAKAAERRFKEIMKGDSDPTGRIDDVMRKYPGMVID